MKPHETASPEDFHDFAESYIEDTLTREQILSVPGVSVLLLEAFNNKIIEAFDEEADETDDEALDEEADDDDDDDEARLRLPPLDDTIILDYDRSTADEPAF